MMKEAAENIDAEKIIELRTSERMDGFYINNMSVYTRAEVDEGIRSAWSGDNPTILKQEIDEIQDEIVVLSPNVAVVSTLIPEGSIYLAGGDTLRVKSAQFGVWMKEGGTWKYHSGQQALWDFDENAFGEE